MKSRVNKSSKIRQILELNPGISNAAVLKALADMKVRVSPQLIHAVRGSMRTVLHGSMRTVKKSSKKMQHEPRPAVAFDDVMATVALGKRMGMDRLKELVEVLS